LIRSVVGAVLVAVVLSACAGPTSDGSQSSKVDAVAKSEDKAVEKEGGKDGGKKAAAVAATVPAKRVDPRKNGFEITLGEWAVTPEAPSLRPGPVKFVIHNRGTMPHGFEIELEGDSSGSGSGDLFKAESELLQPGESTTMRVSLMPGVHKIECLVDGHDDMGMEGPLDVRKNAPLVKEKVESDEGVVAAKDFVFDPSVTSVPVGTEVTWRNEDPSDHTVTALDGQFDSETLAPGSTFKFRFDDPGTFPYRCEIHPDMKGTVKVE
jgi:plastocyanin